MDLMGGFKVAAYAETEDDLTYWILTPEDATVQRVGAKDAQALATMLGK